MNSLIHAWKRVSWEAVTAWKRVKGEPISPSARKLAHRQPGYKIIEGQGIEVGALHEPATVSSRCQVTYCDCLSKPEAVVLYPELKPDSIVEVDHICDLDREGFGRLKMHSYSFVIANQVIEHSANPIKFLYELTRVIKPGGHLAISAPDKNFTFDQPRRLTTFKHLLCEYESGVIDVDDEHYLDFIGAVYPEVLQEGGDALSQMLASVRLRREHSHVWDSASFREFLERSFFEVFQLPTKCLFESLGDQNKFEHFSVWQLR